VGKLDLEHEFGEEYSGRIELLLSEAFTEDMFSLLLTDYNYASMSNRFIFEYHSKYMHKRTNFALIQFSKKENENNFNYYKEFNDFSNFKIRVFARVFNESFNYVDSLDGPINLNDHFNAILRPAKRKFDFYKTDADRKASEVVQELSKYFSKAHLALYKVLTEGDEDIYFVSYNSFGSSNSINKSLFIFRKPFDIFNDEFFLNAIEKLVKEKIDLDDKQINSDNISEYLELIKVLDY
jgi:hypothetical protein